MIFDALHIVDQMLMFLHPAARVILWGAIGGSGSIVLYRFLSPQKSVRRVQRAASSARKQIRRYRGDDFGRLKQLIGRSIKWQCRHLLLASGPTVLACVPLFPMIVWISETYSYAGPEPGSQILVRMEPAHLVVSWNPNVAAQNMEQGVWRLTWPGREESVQMIDGMGRVILTIPTESVRYEAVEPKWWHAVLGGKHASLPRDTPVQRVNLKLPRREIVPIGPSWARTWEMPYFSGLILAAVWLKVLWRIY